VKLPKLDRNLIYALCATIACLLLGVIIYYAIIESRDWDLIIVYIAALAFLTSIAVGFYMKWLKDTE
jgi:ABC-type spermidine/putrescine transport system permease subunit I